jgi:hypothetical protein
MDAVTNRMRDDQSGQDRNGDRSSGPPQAVLAQEDWIQLYTRRILRTWLQREAPLGLAWAYANWIRQDLLRCYRHPLMRAFIEETYRMRME